MNDWIDISQAPQDGTAILAYVPEPWHNGHEPIQVVVKWESRYGDNPKWICDCYPAFSFEPSHFHYLSNPPTI